MPLATQADVTARIGALTAEQLARLPALLADAQAEVEAFAGYALEQAARVQVLHAAGGIIRLPARPVQSVSTVELKDGGSWITASNWAWNGLDEIDVRYRDLVLDPMYDTETYRVSYTAGWPAGQVPQLVVAVVCGMVGRVLTAPSPIDGIVSETIGQYSYQLQQGVGNNGLTVRLTGADEARLRRAGIRQSSGAVFVRCR